MPMLASSAPPGSHGSNGLPLAFIAVRAVVEIVSLEVVALPSTGSDAGAKSQAAPAGRPEQDSDTV